VPVAAPRCSAACLLILKRLLQHLRQNLEMLADQLVSARNDADDAKRKLEEKEIEEEAARMAGPPRPSSLPVHKDLCCGFLKYSPALGVDP